jgi:hypothetical protein
VLPAEMLNAGDGRSAAGGEQTRSKIAETL